MTMLLNRQDERVERMRRMQRSNIEGRHGRKLSAPPGADLRLDVLSLEQRQPGDPIGFKGIAALFDRRALIGSSPWGFFEVIQAGAFSETIVQDDVRMLFNHDDTKPLARNTSEPPTLRLTEIEAGLEVDADMDPVSYALDLAISLERGTVSQMSFAFEALDVEWVTLDVDDPDKGAVMEPELRVVKRVKLWEVSPVTFPAYTDTEAALRNAVATELCREEVDEDLIRVLLERTKAPAIAPPGAATPPTSPGLTLSVAQRRLRMKAREHGFAA